ncbi:MAG: CRISPR-associated endonuclease Cas2, partial [Cetobacterium sp.]
MYVILVYDISFENSDGNKILRNVFKICKRYLTHIQNSVVNGKSFLVLSMVSWLEHIYFARTIVVSSSKFQKMLFHTLFFLKFLV